jgi:hypothetical protein
MSTFFFICSGNPSLIAAFHGLLEAGAPAYEGETGEYSATVDRLQERLEEAKQNATPFEGHSYLGSEEKALHEMSDVLEGLRFEASQEVHVAYVSVNSAGVSWVHEVYDALLKDAMGQGILPFHMYVTEDADAAKVLTASFA